MKVPELRQYNEEEYKALQEKYDDLHHLLEEIAKAIPMYFIVKDTGDDFRYLFSSDKMNQVWGKQKRDVIGKNDFDLETYEIAEKYRQMDEKVLRQKHTRHFTDPITDNEGRKQIMEAFKMLVERKNKPPYIVGMAWDITRQIAIENELLEYHKRLAWACQIGKIYPWLMDTRENAIELTMSHRRDIETIRFLLKDFDPTVHPEDLPQYNEAVNHFLLEKDDQPLRVAMRTNFFTGEYVWFEIIGEIFERDENGKAVRAIGVLRDITIDKENEEAEKAKQLAEESDRMKSAFIANMSHEIRTPLNAIVGFSNLLANVETKEEKDQFLKIIESNNEYLLQLINDILDISKIESGKMEFNYSAFNLDELFTEQEKAFILRADPGVDVIFEKGEHNYDIYSEKIRFKQVLSNFLSNAIKYTSEGSIRFGYKAKEASLYVYVTDTGSGMPSNIAPTVFDRFVKLDSFKQGTGLGLSISKSIIDVLDGQIGVISALGEGSTFWFEIPCEPVIV